VVVDAAWESASFELGTEWALLLHTDGLIEGRGPVPGEPLWEDGLLDMLEQERDTDLEQLPARLVERAQDLNGGPLSDDVAILLLSSDTAPQDAPQAAAPPSVGW
jgi:serine phosphatase RsbU (regulator of sigma subunit)